MSIIDLIRSKELKALKLTREQIAVRAMEIAKHIVENGSYKNAVAGIGRMRILSMAISDGYWQEKRMHGEESEVSWLLHGSSEAKDWVVK